MNNPYLKLSEEVKKCLEENKPVVALESTIISHGMPYPDNVKTALKVEKIIRDNGATPATIAIINGKLIAGCSREEIEYLGKMGERIPKVSRRNLAINVSEKKDGATTVAATMIIAKMAGIPIFATGGIGGVHRGAEKTMDISADLEELAQTPVMVICAGPKAILDLKLTLEYLETKGVPVLGFKTEKLPAFYTKSSHLNVDYKVKSPEELAQIYHTSRELKLKGGILVTNPIPDEFSMDEQIIDQIINTALKECDKLRISGKDITPFLLNRIKELSNGESLNSNIQLVFNNARLAAKTAVALSYLKI